MIHVPDKVLAPSKWRIRKLNNAEQFCDHCAIDMPSGGSDIEIQRRKMYFWTLWTFGEKAWSMRQAMCKALKGEQALTSPVEKTSMEREVVMLYS